MAVNSQWHFKFNGNTYTIVYNGQIYNANELRNILERKRFSFESHSDTEVLLKAFVHFGKDVVNNLNGVFAFAIWNENKKNIYGKRPFWCKAIVLYYKRWLLYI